MVSESSDGQIIIKPPIGIFVENACIIVGDKYNYILANIDACVYVRVGADVDTSPWWPWKHLWIVKHRQSRTLDIDHLTDTLIPQLLILP